MSEPIKHVDVIDATAVIDIGMSTEFYSRLQDMIGFILEGKTQDEITDAGEQIKSNNIKDPWVEHFKTLLMICKEFESQAQTKGLIKKVPIES